MYLYGCLYYANGLGLGLTFGHVGWIMTWILDPIAKWAGRGKDLAQIFTLTRMGFIIHSLYGKKLFCFFVFTEEPLQFIYDRSTLSFKKRTSRVLCGCQDDMECLWRGGFLLAEPGKSLDTEATDLEDDKSLDTEAMDLEDDKTGFIPVEPRAVPLWN